jgi:hypothetical protein
MLAYGSLALPFVRDAETARVHRGTRRRGGVVSLKCEAPESVCDAHDISVAYYYVLRKTGGVPREMRVGRRFLISLEAAAESAQDARGTETTMTKKLPGEGAAEGDPYDCTGLIGQLGEDAMCEWPMSSFDAPAYTVWNAIAATFNRAGWSDHQIRDWLQSKQARWAMDMDLGEVLRAAGEAYARKILRETGG